MKAEAKKRLTKFVNSLFSVVLVVGLLPTWALSNPQQAYAAAADYTVTATVDGLDDDTLPVLVGGTDFTPGQPVNADPVYYTDADGNTPLADLAAQKAKQGLSLKWTDAETGKDFSWTETKINKSYKVEGSWVQTQCTVTVNANDGGKTAKQEVTVPWGKSYASVKGGAPATPTYSGWQFLGWYTQDGKQYDFNSKVTESLVVEAKWAVADVTVVPTTNPDNDIDQNLSGTCWVGATWSWHPAQFALSNFSGKLAGVTATGYCADRSAAPASNVQATYSATLRSVNTETGEVVYDLYITPPDATNGKDRNQYGLIGYQHISAQITLIKNFGGWLEINKSSSNPAISDNNDCYDLEGAEYAVFNSSNQAVAKLTTDANGYAKSGLLPSGNYTVKELKAPKGYALDENGYQVRITSGQTTTSNLADKPQSDPVGALLGKYDGEKTYTGEGNLPLGSAKLYGAQYSIEYYDGYYNTEAEAQASGNPTRKWVLQTDEDGYVNLRYADQSFDIHDADGNVTATLPYKVSGDDFYRAANGAISLPLGTAIIKEIKAPQGYNLPQPYGMDQVFVRQITSDGNLDVVHSYNAPEVAEPIMRSDVEFTKAASDDSHSLAGVPFKITSKTTGESHVIVTDENGKASTKASWNKHTQDTNGNDWIMSEDAEGVQGFVAKLLDAAKVLDPTCGVWFGQYTDGDETKITDPDDERGALPYDEYTLEELPCDANAGYQLIKKDFTISRDNSFNADNTVNLGTLTDQDVSISTQAYDKADGDQEVVAEPDVTVVDKVSCDNLQKGTEYIINGTLMDKATGKPYVDAAGNEVHGSVTFTAKSQEQDAYVEFTFDGSNLTDSTELVVFEDLATTENPDRILADHKELGDLGQTVTVKPPVIGTIATDGIDNDKQVVKDTEMVVTDTVAYYGLTPGKQYTLKGELMDKATGTVLKDAAGNPVTAEKQFTPNTTAGTVEIQFTFDGSNLKKDQNLVAFEHVLTKDKEIAAHAEITDIPQTVTVIEPSIKTTAKSSQAGHENSDNVIRDTTATVKDTVEYKNLVPGKEYTLIGKMMDKATGAALLKADGTEATGKATFTPETANGTATVEITFDCADLDGHSLVAFEKLYRGETTIASHEDIDDVDQTVKVDTPLVETTATSNQAGHEGDKNVVRDTTATVVDTVHYEGLVIGKTYTVSGTLMDKATGKAFIAADGSTVTAAKVFTAKATDGDITLEFTFDASALEGKKLVAFEKISQDGKEVGTHEDINDEDQTITVVNPKISTTATSNQAGHEGDKSLVRDTTATIKDSIEYKGLVTGKEYTFTGKVMDKTTGKALLNKDGSEVTASKTFVADDTYGTVELELTVDCAELNDHDLVVFEKLYQDGKEVGSHENINDEGQTVKVVTPEIGTTATSSQAGHEGDHNVVRDTTATVVDTVHYEGLVIGKTYTVSGTLMDKETGKAFVTAAGNEVTASKEFTPKAADGDVTLEFTLDTSDLEGKELVAFEKVSQDGKEIGVHEDITDDNQTIKVVPPTIKTTATSSQAGHEGDKNLVRDTEATLTDTIKYEGLVTGKTYTFTGKVMDKVTGKALLNADGSEVTVSKTITADDTYGTVELEFTVNCASLDGHDLVVYEKVYQDGKEVGSHEDLNDGDQTVKVVSPELATTAIDGIDGDKNVVKDPEAEVTDTVEYKGLVTGKEYTVTGTIMDKATGNPYIDPSTGKEITGETTFTPDDTYGTVDVKFAFDASQLDENSQLVVFEKISRNGEEVGNHEDIDDEAQAVSIIVPEIRTNAADGLDGDKEVIADHEATVVDTVSYEKLVPGKTYVVSGTLMVKETGEALLDAEGNPVTASTEFVPEAPEGTVDVVFTFDSDLLAGKDLVAFEKLYRNQIEITVHEDIDDEDQTTTVVPPRIGTTATDTADGDKHMAADPESSITDEIQYKNLVPGDEYMVAGILMDKSTGLPLLSGEGASAVSAEDLQKFTDELMAACGLDGGSDAVTVDDQAFGEGYEVTATDNGYEYTDELGVKHVLAKGDEGWKLTELEGTIETEVGTYTDDQVTVTKGEATLPLNPDYEAVAKVMQENPDIVSCLSIQKMTFTPDEQTGSVSMDFPINSIYNEDTETVVFEFLFKGSELIAHESDIDNEGQTVEIVTPKLSTTATDKTDGDHTLLPSREATVVDHVEYTDLIPGKEYTIEGVLMDKSTGTELIVGDGKVTAVATFVPNHADGSVDLEFTFDASELGGKDLVAFEVAYKDGIQIADHQDIDDEGQTVSVSPVVDNGQDTPGDGYSKTGVDMTLVYALIAALVALAGGAGAYALRQRKLAAAEGKEEDGSDKE